MMEWWNNGGKKRKKANELIFFSKLNIPIFQSSNIPIER
jgi:hypothetical protein